MAHSSTFVRLLPLSRKIIDMEYKELVQHLSFKKLDTLKEAVDITRDFAVANRLETEAGVSHTSSAPRKTHQVFSLYGGGVGAQSKNSKSTGTSKDRKVQIWQQMSL